MSIHVQPAEQAITEDDDVLAAALEEASIPTLLLSVVHLSGDASLLDGPIRPRRPTLGEIQGKLSEDDKAAARAIALDALRAYRDRGCTLPPPPSAETVRKMMRFLVAEDVPDEYVPMVLEELALDGEDHRSVSFDDIPAARRDAMHVVIVGAGMSGLLAALRMQEAGIRYTVIEKNDAVGGTWYENRYPGCRVDIANHFYSYSFEPNHDWSEHFSKRDELFAYFDGFADRHEIRRNIRFSTEAVSCHFDERSALWEVTVRTGGPQGAEEVLRANAVISAVGQLNRPFVPDIAGRERFRGVQVHSAAYDPSNDLRGKRVAVVGTGASAFQIVPEVAKEAAQLYVFQRSPVWMLPNSRYHETVGEKTKWLLKHVPYYARWYRFLLFWPGSDGAWPSLFVDPEWPHQDRSINALNDALRSQLTAYLERQVGDDPELLAKVVPTYPPMGKRMLQDNGSWIRALKQPNVEVVTEGVTEMDETGIVGRTQHYDVDVVIYATGFHADKFLWPMDVVGAGGRSLRDLWGDEPLAYLGITVPGFPNLFCLYGPGTNLAHAGSIIFHSECQVRYVEGALHQLLAGGYRTMDVKPAAYDDYNRRAGELLARSVWAHPSVDNWYKNKAGRVITTSPWRLVDYWTWTREPDPQDYVYA